MNAVLKATRCVCVLGGGGDLIALVILADMNLSDVLLA